MHHRQQGVTLVQIVIAVLIVGLVVAVLIPVFPGSGSRRFPRLTSCASNMKQLGLGFIQYVQDYDNKYPGNNWAVALYPYEKSNGVYHCPEDMTQPNEHAFPVSYAMNSNVAGHSIDKTVAPSATVLACEFDGAPLTTFTVPEQTAPTTNGVTPNTAWGGIRLGTSSTTANPTRHDPSLIFLNADGRAKALRPEKVSSGADQTTSAGTQDATHASATGLVGKPNGYALTFSER